MKSLILVSKPANLKEDYIENRTRLLSEMHNKQRRSMSLFEAKKIAVEHDCKEYHSKNGYALEESAQRGGGSSILGNVLNFNRQSPQ